MAALSDQIDRLSRNTRSIRSTTAKIGLSGSGSHLGVGVAGPFARAVLSTPLGDLIRDVDPSELGLFNLVSSSAGSTRAHERDTRAPSNPEIARVEFPGPTPLRKRAAKRDDMQRPKEFEPEVYAQAALKYLDRYEPIRPMPRAHSQVTSIMEQVSAVRNSMETLTKTLEQITSADAQYSHKDQADAEARRIQALQTEIIELKKRKEVASKQGKASSSKSRQTPIRRTQKGKPTTPISSAKNGDHEETFWNTPADAARTLRFDNLLKDELAELGDISMSFASPIPPTRSTSSRFPSLPQRTNAAESTQKLDPGGSGEIPPDHDSERLDDYDDDLEPDVDVEGEDDKTIVLKKPEPPPSSPPTSPMEEQEPSTPIRESSVSGTPSRSKKLRVKINSEVERIVSKIWSTAGDVIMPGNLFASSGTTGAKPPRAKETISHLHTVSAYTPMPLSPSISSESSHSAIAKEPTGQQILTAHLLLVLLSSPPHFSMSMNKLKEELVTKAGGSAAALSMGTTRIIYGCVAKRLLRIERGGGEQVVQFDI